MTSATLADIFDMAQVALTPETLATYEAFWEPRTVADPLALPTLQGLKSLGMRVGVLSNTIWPKARHEYFFERDGLSDLIDSAVYTSETPFVKPHPQTFADIAHALRVEPRDCVFVGDRPYDDIWGAQQAGMRTILIPHSDIPVHDAGLHSGIPDAKAHQLDQVVTIVSNWINERAGTGTETPIDRQPSHAAAGAALRNGVEQGSD